MKKILFYLSAICLLASCDSVPKEPIDYVDPFIGTGFHGHTYPGATTPNGSVQLSPDTRIDNWDACSGYHYSDSSIIGFSHTHLSGTGAADLGDILFHPTTKEAKLDKGKYIFDFLEFSHKDEKASPGYYSVLLRNEGIKAELTATRYAGVHRYTYDTGKNQSIIIDLAHVLKEEVIDSLYLIQTSDTEIVGMRRSHGWVKNHYVFFVAQFSQAIKSIRYVTDGKHVDDLKNPSSKNSQAIIEFGNSDGTPLISKLGLSLVSAENARANLSHDMPDNSFDFDAVHQQAREAWKIALSDITIEGATEDHYKNFYTALYHTKVVPNIVNDANGQYRRHDMSIGQLREGEKYYSTLSLWDTFRAWNPLQTITDTELVNAMINSMLDMYDASGELPIWPLASGETFTMIGYHSVSVIADAYMKGIRGYDVELAFEAMKVSSNINKKGSSYYTQYGFIPANIQKESVSRLLEFAYDDWCIAMVAKDMGKEKDYEEYAKRALYYINIFDGNYSFFKGKRLDGNWEEGFSEFAPLRSLTEATPWQYRFFAPHDVNGLIQLFGSQEKFAKELDRLFTINSDIEGDMVDITGMIGQYAHGNEPSHHMAYLYNYVGQPWKTQEMTRRILDEMYQPTPEGISGNEDCGQMSAWYILSSMGMYPVSPASNEFSLTTPLFEKMSIKLANGNTLTITANNPKRNKYIDKVTVDGQEITKNYITYAQIMGAKNIDFTLRADANMERGTSADATPYSFTEGKVVSIPYSTKDLYLFEENIDVEFASTTEGAKIYYTTNGTEPTESSTPYTAPFNISTTTDLKVKAFKEDYAPSQTYFIKATKAIFENARPALAQTNGLNYRYYHGLVSTVYDIESKLKLIETSTMPEPSIKGAKQEDDFAYIFTGFIHAPEDGVYEFSTVSDDGSVLEIDGKKVVDNDGGHAAIRATGQIALRKGYHQLKLMYFEDYSGQHLGWTWRTPSADAHVVVPANVLFTK